MRILVIEDEKELAQTIKRRLKDHFVVDLAANGTEGTYFAQINQYDLILLDIGLPDMTGIEVCRMTRAANIKTPILMLTGRKDVASKVSSLDSGADDYLVKPFDFDELLARIRALLRRNLNTTASNKLFIGNLSLDPKTKDVTRDGKTIPLRRKEFDLLEYFMKNPNKILTREILLEAVWQKGLDVTSNTVDAHVSSLRKRIEKRHGKKLIKTVHGIGYKLEM